MKERVAISSSGWLAIVVGLGLFAGALALFVQAAHHQQAPALYATSGVVLIVAGMLLLGGCFVIGPNEARVLTFFGRYTGTVREAGLRWATPFTSKPPISLRARNFDTGEIKVNDLEGNPIEIGAVIVWRVVDTAQAMFDVEDFMSFVKIQAETVVNAGTLY